MGVSLTTVKVSLSGGCVRSEQRGGYDTHLCSEVDNYGEAAKKCKEPITTATFQV